MKKVFLFNPPSGLYRRDNRCQNKVEDQTVNVIFPPMELLYCAAILEKEGHQVWVKDYPAANGDWDNFIQDLKQILPDFTLLTTSVATLETDLIAAEIIKEHLPETCTAAKGEPLHHMDQEIIKANPHLDIILRGEVESYIHDWVAGETWPQLPDVTFMQNSQVIRTSENRTLTDLDSLPFPARHLIDNTLYRSPETQNPITTIVTSVGCPHKCIFCSVPILTGTTVRFRSPGNVVAELEDCVHRYGIHEFLFHADTFTLKKPWVIELCQRIVDKKLDIRWGCNSRVDTIDEERLQWMKKAGCWVIGFGVESGSDINLERMKKRATAAQAKEAVQLCRKNEIRSHAFFVFGFPWDTEESILELIGFAKELDPDFFDFNLAFPIPGTELDTMVTEQNLVSKEKLHNGGYAVGAVSTNTLSAGELEKWRKKALWTMYLRPHYVFRTLRNAGSFSVTMNYIRAALTRARNLIFSGKNNKFNLLKKISGSSTT